MDLVKEMCLQSSCRRQDQCCPKTNHAMQSFSFSKLAKQAAVLEWCSSAARVLKIYEVADDEPNKYISLRQHSTWTTPAAMGGTKPISESDEGVSAPASDEAILETP